MSVQKHECMTLRCDGCKRTYEGYEGEYTVHFSSHKEIAETLQEDVDESYQWSIEGDKHYCDSCTCERRDNHALVESAGSYRFCKCGDKSEKVAS